MKNVSVLFYLSLLISFSAFSQPYNNENDSIKYFNHGYFPISKTDYENRKFNSIFWSIPGDSTNHVILAYKEIESTLKNKKELDSILSSATKQHNRSHKTNNYHVLPWQGSM